MAKQTVNIGTSANDRTGDSLRSAFNKINENFTELYTELGINDDSDLNLGAFEFAGSVMTTTDSSAITIAQNLSVTSDITVGGDIVPNITEEHNLGGATRRFKDLYLSGNTIDLGGTTLSIVDGNLQVGGLGVTAGSIDYSEIENTPAIPNLGNWTFSNSVLSDGSTGNAVIQSSDFAGSKLILRARGVSDQDWVFDQDGDLTFPDGTIQTTAYPGITVSNNTVATGSSLTRDLLTIRVDDDGNDGMYIALKYSDPVAPREVSASATWVESTTPASSGGNLWGGSTTLSANNNSFINVTNQPFSAAGDTVTVIFTDHSAHKIYRITAQARQIPQSGVTPGSAYVVIEELK